MSVEATMLERKERSTEQKAKGKPTVPPNCIIVRQCSMLRTHCDNPTPVISYQLTDTGPK